MWTSLFATKHECMHECSRRLYHMFILLALLPIQQAPTSSAMLPLPRTSLCETVPQAKVLTLERLLAGIRVMRATDFAELLATVHMLPELLAAAPEVRMQVESFATPALRFQRSLQLVASPPVAVS